MQHQNDADQDDVGMSRVKSFLRSSTLFYVAMGGVGALICYYQHELLISALAIPGNWADAGKLVALGLLGAAVLLILNHLFEEQFASYKAFRHVLMQMVGAASLSSAFYLAFISAVGEELLFRGAIQPVLGLIGTAFLFGLLHLGPQGLVSIWTLWAVLSGLLLGWMFDATHSFWPSLICHFLVNSVSMLRLRLQYRAFLKAHAKHEAGKKLLSGR